jgi:hypothetical protein
MKAWSRVPSCSPKSVEYKVYEKVWGYLLFGLEVFVEELFRDKPGQSPLPWHRLYIYMLRLIFHNMIYAKC